MEQVVELSGESFVRTLNLGRERLGASPYISVGKSQGGCSYYYQGRIYQNMNEQDRALRSFMRGLDIADACKDSLTIARMLVAQAAVYMGLWVSMISTLPRNAI